MRIFQRIGEDYWDSKYKYEFTTFCISENYLQRIL